MDDLLATVKEHHLPPRPTYRTSPITVEQTFDKPDLREPWLAAARRAVELEPSLKDEYLTWADWSWRDPDGKLYPVQLPP